MKNGTWVLVALAMGLTGCMGGSTDLRVSSSSLSGGPIQLVGNSGESLQLDGQTIQKVESISLYDFDGNARLSLSLSGVVATPIFTLGIPSDSIPNKMSSGVHADASATGQNASIDLDPTTVEPVHNEFDSTKTCTTEDQVTQCKGEGREQVCKTVTIVHHGSEPTHVTEEGNIYNFELKITQAASKAVFGANYDDIRRSSYATGPCVTSD